MRRTRVLTNLIAFAALVGAGVFIATGPQAEADTATPTYANEGWFARNKPPAPQAGVPCEPVPTPRCGPASPGGVPTPQAPDTGAYVVGSSGGTTGDQSDLSGDTAWAAFQWDVFGQLGADVDKFVVTLTQTPQTTDQTTSRRGDTYNGSGTPPPVQACNIVVAWSASIGSNPWETRPQTDSTCVAPKVEGTKFTFDVTSMAQTWLEGTGHGFVIMPGTPGSTGATGTLSEDDDVVQPFQITFSGYETTLASPTREEVIPKVTFEFTPALEDDGTFGTIGGGGGGVDLFEEVTTIEGSGGFAATPNIDVIPTDVGSAPVPEVVASAPTVPSASTRTVPISRKAGFPYLVLLLLPFIAIAFWGTGTALGPVGDPVPARQGGVTRVLARRQGSTDFDAR